MTEHRVIVVGGGFAGVGCARRLARHDDVRGTLTDRHHSLLDQGALTFVIVGGGATGVELAGALADLVHETMAAEYHDLAVTAAQIHLIDRGPALLAPFSDRAHDYAAKVLTRRGVQ